MSFKQRWQDTDPRLRPFLIGQVAIAVALLVAILFLLTGCVPRHPEVGPPVDVWAWCGVHPDDPYAQAKANTMATKGGVDVVFGPCLAPDWATYSPAFPGQRYLAPEGYMRAVKINAKAGMKTVVYDARITSSEPEQRQAAIDFWAPVLPWIAAWDMGDEFDPAGPDWPILVERWNTVMEQVYPLTHVLPYTNNLGSAQVLDQALADMPSMANLLSFDAYDIESSFALAEEFSGQVRDLMCAVNGIKHGPWTPSPLGVTQQMLDHRELGCTKILIFGGDIPWDTPELSTPSLVTRTGRATQLDVAVLEGAN